MLRLALAALMLTAAAARGSVTVLVGEPFGSFGTMLPSGHTTIYLDRVCADTPTHLHLCRPGEAAGVALARYDHLGEIDWVAIPILPFLYGTDDPSAMLPYATPATLEAVRESYRRAHLESVFPDEKARSKHYDEWVETLGMAYIRKTYGYRLDTTVAQDEAVIERLNAQVNRHRYHIHAVNCADFAANIVDMYYPGTVGAAGFVNFYLTSPKQVARDVSDLGRARPELEPAVFVIEQLPGSFRRSRPARFAAETLLKQKRYVFTIAVIQPEALIALYAMYRDNGGAWRLGKRAEPVGPWAFVTAGLPPPEASAQSSTD